MSGQLQEMEIRDLSCDVFQVFQHATPLLSAGSAEKFNTMVIGWGGLGTLWGKAVCTVYVRPQRYTYEFMERENAFSVSVLPPECREALRVCGSESGRDVDKVKKCGLTPAFSALGAPYFEQAQLVLVCRKLYVQDLDLGGMAEKVQIFYGPAQGGIHRAYTGEILEAYTFS